MSTACEKRRSRSMEHSGEGGGKENFDGDQQDCKRACNVSSPVHTEKNSVGSCQASVDAGRKASPKVLTEERQTLLETKTGEISSEEQNANKNDTLVKSSSNDSDTVADDQESSELSAEPVLDVNSKISYTHASSYWSGVPATVDGMLGGFGHISSTDIGGSDNFLKWLFNRKDSPGRARCVDCGAGIGRITQKLLQRHFGKVDLVEQSPAFTDKAREIFAENPKIGDIFCLGLQDFAPSPATYDVVWVQWVLIYLPDEALVAYFRRMGEALRPNGVLVVKENFTTGDSADPAETLLDEEDSSVTRPLEYVIKLATEAGLTLVRSVQQKKFPKQLFKVYMLAFRPSQYSAVSSE